MIEIKRQYRLSVMQEARPDEGDVVAGVDDRLAFQYCNVGSAVAVPGADGSPLFSCCISLVYS